MAGTSQNPKSTPAEKAKKSTKTSAAAKKPSSGSAAGKKTAGSAAQKPASSRAPKTGTGKATSKNTASGSGKAASAASSRDPIRNRRLKVFFCLMLAFFAFIGCFTKEGIFIWFFRRFMQGLIGKGFYFLPVALVFCAAMLEYVRDRPLSGRITCTLLLTVTMGALLHLFRCTTAFPWSWKLLGELYDSGILAGEAGSGGTVAGLIAVLFESLFNRVGAAIVLILGTVFLLFTAVDVTIAALIDRGREQSKQKVEEWRIRREEERILSEERRKAAEEAVRERRESAERAERAAAESDLGLEALPRHPVTASAPRTEQRTASRTKKSDSFFDIPLDDDPAPAEKPAPGPVSKPAAKKTAGPIPADPEKPVRPVPDSPAPRKDWLTEMLNKDRERAEAKKQAEARKQAESPARPKPPAADPKATDTADAAAAAVFAWLNGSRSDPSSKIVHTAIHPKASPSPVEVEKVPSVHISGTASDELPLQPLPEEPEEEPAEAAVPPEEPVRAERSEQPPVRPVSTAIRAKERTPEPEKPAITPQVPPAAKPAPVTLKPSVTPEAAAEAAAVLADEKAAKAVEKAETARARAEMVATIEENLAGEAEQKTPPYVFPPLELLTAGAVGDSDEGLEEMTVNAKRLNAAIKSFGIPAEICDVVRGPTVTRYEVELEQGVKLNRLTNLADDIALALGASGVRIAPVPDKISIVGIEVPNKKTTTVYLRDILDTPAFQDKAGALPFAVGKDIGGAAIVGDISKLPHLMIAGTTGSGKSVCMNSLILSLLYKCSPEDVRLIMVDPKMIELGIYNGIPHLLIPVVTDPKKAAGALQWAVMEMLKRNALLAESGARDIAGYNRLMEREGGQKLPRMVILIDELADLMMTAAKDVEDSICRIAAVGRAAGIHMVVATQRPSADVITGLMKANISSRIAFAVDSALNSRIILDTSGAEKLVGKGDMLYSPIGMGKPVRVQGTFVTDEEREDVIGFVKQQGLAQYSRELQDEIERSAEKDSKKSDSDEDADSGDMGELDELFDDAVDVVLDSKQASVSMLQRRLKLGYARAARIVDQMEEQGVVGPYEGSKPRQVLLTRAEWNAMRGIESMPDSEDAADPEDAETPDAPPDEQESFDDYDDDELFTDPDELM